MSLEVADDFVLADSIPITGFTLWGGYNNGPTVADSFLIRLFADSVGQPGALLWESAPESTSRTLTGATVLSGIYPEYLYTVTLPMPFPAQAGVRYWLGIVNPMPEAETWQWELTSPTGSPSPGIQRFDGTAWQPHAVLGTSFTVVPEPSSFALSLCSLAAWWLFIRPKHTIKFKGYA